MVELGWPSDWPATVAIEVCPVVHPHEKAALLEQAAWAELVYGKHSSLRNAKDMLHAATLCGLGDLQNDYEATHRRPVATRDINRELVFYSGELGRFRRLNAHPMGVEIDERMCQASNCRNSDWGGKGRLHSRFNDCPERPVFNYDDL